MSGDSTADIQDASSAPEALSASNDGSGEEPAPPKTLPPIKEEFMIMDFEDGLVHDAGWLATQPEGAEYTVPILLPKNDSGRDTFSIARGQGVGGSNALLVTADSPEQGLLGFWIYPQFNRNGNRINPRDEKGYLLPRGRKANFLEFDVRFKPGHRKVSAAAQPPAYPNTKNVEFGTYHFDPDLIDGKTWVAESNGWHFYYQIFLRHDAADGDWIHVVLNETPQHIRTFNGLLPVNPTQPKGNLWEIATQLYFDEMEYFADPQIPYPIQMWVDNIKLTYRPSDSPVVVNIQSYSIGQDITVVRGEERYLNVELRNNGSERQCGSVSWKIGDNRTRRIFIAENGERFPEQLCLEPFNSVSGKLVVRPSSSLDKGFKTLVGVSFNPDNERISGADFANRSLSDPRVEQRRFPERGAMDGFPVGDHVRVIVP